MSTDKSGFCGYCRKRRIWIRKWLNLY